MGKTRNLIDKINNDLNTKLGFKKAAIKLGTTPMNESILFLKKELKTLNKFPILLYPT